MGKCSHRDPVSGRRCSGVAVGRAPSGAYRITVCAWHGGAGWRECVYRLGSQSFCLTGPAVFPLPVSCEGVSS